MLNVEIEVLNFSYAPSIARDGIPQIPLEHSREYSLASTGLTNPSLTIKCREVGVGVGEGGSCLDILVANVLICKK